MKRLKQHWSARPLSLLLAVAMMWHVLLFMLGTGPANAQTALNGTPTWAVLDFENHSGYGGAEVGRTASDAFVVELGKSNKYEVLSRQETQQGLANTGQTPPLDMIGLQKLGRDRGVAAVATGEVAAVTFTNNPRQATASVIIRVVDTTTGELVNGALAQGRSNPRAISSNDDDALVNEAINNAAFAAVRQITQFNLPKATVLISRDQDSVVVNRGTRDGLYNGLNMVVTRNGSEVGRIRISDASADQSTAVVTRRGLGIQPQDRTTAIYQLPEYTVKQGALQARSDDVASDGAKSGSKRNAFSGVTGIILAILAGALLFTLIKRGSASGSLGGAQVGKPLAVEGRQDVLGGSGYAPGTIFAGILPGDAEAALNLYPQQASTIPATSFTPVVVKVTATTGNISINNFLEFHVYRSDFPTSLNNYNVSTGTTTSGSGFVGFGQLPLNTSTGRNSLVFYDDGADKIVPPASKPSLALGTTSGSISGNNSSTGNSLSVSPLLKAGGTGIQRFGARIQYYIEGLYIQPATDGGSTSNPGSPGNTGVSNTSGNGNNNNTGGSGSTSGNTTGNTGHPATFQLTGRTPTNFVTYITPVQLTSNQVTAPTGDPNSDTIINVTAVPPTVTDNILELSSSIGFEKKFSLKPADTGSPTIGPFQVNPLNPQGDATSSRVIWYLRNNFQNSGHDVTLGTLFPAATVAQVFARIGTRDPLNGPSTTTNPYVYSDPVQLR